MFAHIAIFTSCLSDDRERGNKKSFSHSFVTNLININLLSSSVLCITVVPEDRRLGHKGKYLCYLSKGKGLYQQQSFEVFPVENVVHSLRIHDKINVGWKPS